MPSTENIIEAVKDKPIEHISLGDLQLDPHNPRFAEFLPSSNTQRDIVNMIVKQFGVDDVLSSIAVSGYFSAEPLVCKEQADGTYVVVEGNRRLAAMLILSDSDRGQEHSRRREKYQQIHVAHGSPAFDPVPAIVFTEQDSSDTLLSYLGVRHIVSTKEWDSYAKAAWVSRALNTSNLNLADIAEMIGDTRGTIQRMLLGFHFVEQLKAEGQFNPENSLRKGRGSNTEYPFSWIYTVLGFEPVRKFIELDSDPVNIAPIPPEKFESAGLVVRSMFGDSSQGVTPSISDSRQITDLAKVLASPDKVAYLRQGKSVKEIERLTKPLDELLGGALIDVLGNLREIAGRLSEEDIDPSAAAKLLRTVTAIKKQANSLHQTFSDAAANNSNITNI